VIKKLNKKYPQQKIYQLGVAEALLEQEKNQPAERILRKLYQRYPGDYPIAFNYGDVLLKNNRYQLAEQVLKKIVPKHAQNIQLTKSLGRAQAGIKHYADAYQSYAKASLLIGDKTAARMQLTQALKQKKLSVSERKKIKEALTRL
jgi:predicted Zn-dependent protease